jgi:phage baseplate assembly protein gpV
MTKVVNNFAGLNGCIWWMGVIENRIDPLKLGRCQVRIFGWHTDNKQLIPSEDLPWVAPIISGNSAQTHKTPKEGEYVVGLFMDSDSGQFPFYFGVLPGIPVVGPNQGVGFSDPRTKEQVAKAPIPFGGKPSLFPNELNEPTTSRLYRNEKIQDTIIARENNSLTTGVTTADGATWSQPGSSYAAVQPYNQVTETESGHVFELDDTQGAERVHLAHRTGTFFEMHPDGSKVTKIVGDNYEIVAGTNFVSITGDCNITVNGNVTLNTSGKVIAKASEFDLTGNINLDGSINATGDVVGGGISLEKHIHGGVMSGGSITGLPQ